MGFLDDFMTKREIKRLSKIVDKVNSFENDLKGLTNEDLRKKSEGFKERLTNGSTVDEILPEAFAVCREASSRILGMRHYDVQIMGGIVLNEGRIAEMKTGEGKTLVATLPVYLNALTGNGVHVITVNDYLAKRDMEQMGKLYNFLGLTTGVIVHGLDNEQRREAYNSDITYGTNNEFGFDYLRDNMVIFKNNMVQRPLNYAIVDEVDSILVDEARTPLIISGQGQKSTQMYTLANTFVNMLKLDVDYTINEKENASVLTDEGIEKACIYFNVDSLTDIANMEVNHHIAQALRANTLMRRDVDYVVKDDEIIIVDEFTGRLMFGRRYSDGLHQAIEAKEGVKVQRESKTLATITFQNYFRMYKKLSGMTGTAKTEEDEFRSIYKMDVIQIPTNKPVVRKDHEDVIYKNEEQKYRAVIEEVVERHKSGQPILIGTISIENSEILSGMLKRKGVVHEVLNAKNHGKEAEIVAQAGRYNAVTIATNMAGRGTDIILGGNPNFLTDKEMRRLGYEDRVISFASGFAPTEEEELLLAREEYQKILNVKKKEIEIEQKQVINAGGLAIIGTERHESRRIDNQLRGRSGRQGDPGETRFYISLEDELMRLFGSERIAGIIEKVGLEDDTPIEAKMLTRSIESAQKKVEGKNFSVRKTVLQYDDVMNKQREIIYNERRRVLEGEDLKEQILKMIEEVAESVISSHVPDGSYPEEWDLKAIQDSISMEFGIKLDLLGKNIENISKNEIIEEVISIAKSIYAEKEEKLGENSCREVERVILLQAVDTKWMDHIDAMDQLRQGMGLRAIGQEDPIRAYQLEGFEMFDSMTNAIKTETVRHLMMLQVDENVKSMERKQVVCMDELEEVLSAEETVNKPKKSVKSAGRNEICPCGSGKKYKKCCGKDI
ncbi:MAG: preprotein translocase subunit SecA [Filifactoraceae bacterium]